MRRTELLQEMRAMRFEEAYRGWQQGRLRQEEAAQLLGVCERSFGATSTATRNRGWRG
jgi:hypothetical protein